MTRLRVAIIADLHVALPPKTYGGIERVLCSVAQGLHQLGHDVTVFGPDESNLPFRVIPFGSVLGEQHRKSWRDVARLWRLLNKHHRDFDVIHNFFGAKYLLPVLPRRIVKLISYACPVSSKVVRLTNLLGGNSIHYTVCGAHMIQALDASIDRSRWSVIYNPIDPTPYEFHERSNAHPPYLAFLSRMCIAKGVHHAIEVARRVGMPLVIAGNIQASDRPYFERDIKPHVDNVNVRFIGPVNESQKNDLLGNARAMLFPIIWEEPFGLVVGESMACGTPVIAFRRGAMPELIAHGKTGFLCDNIDEMTSAIGNIDQLDRHACRESVLRRFAPEVITAEYEKLYLKLLGK
jgi:glycosyltransferase involved in cell wall biosynthesis